MQKKSFLQGLNQFWIGAVFGLSISIALILIPLGWVTSNFRDIFDLEASINISSNLEQNIDKVSDLVAEVKDILESRNTINSSIKSIKNSISQ